MESEVSRSVAATDPDQLPLLNEIAANTTSITTTFQDPSPITYASTATSGSLHGSELFVDAPAISSSSFFLQQQQQQELFAEAFINEQDRGDEEQHRELVVEDKEEVVSVEGVAERQHVEEEVVEEVSLTPITSSASSIVPDDTEEEEEKEEKEKTDEVKVEEEDESIELDRNSNNSGNFDEDEDLCVVMTSSIAIEMEDDTTSASSSSNTATRIPDSPPSIDHFEDEFVFL